MLNYGLDLTWCACKWRKVKVLSEAILLLLLSHLKAWENNAYVRFRMDLLLCYILHYIFSYSSLSCLKYKLQQIILASLKLLIEPSIDNHSKSSFKNAFDICKWDLVDVKAAKSKSQTDRQTGSYKNRFATLFTWRMSNKSNPLRARQCCTDNWQHKSRERHKLTHAWAVAVELA